MGARTLGQTAIRNRLIPLVLIALASALLGIGCSSQPACSAGLHPYKDKCLTNMAIQYVGCVEGKGINTTTEISAGAGGTLKVVADASLNLALKRSEQENTPVALQIVKDCMDIAKTNSPPDDLEQSLAAMYQRDWQDLVISQTPSLTISPSSARDGEQVTVTGSQFWPNEMVDIRLNVEIVDQLQADESGGFSTVITVSASAAPPGFPSAVIAIGQSSAKSAQAPFKTAP